MRIAFYSNWYVKQTVPLANALAERHEISVIFPKVGAHEAAGDGCVKPETLRKILSSKIKLYVFSHMQKLDVLGWIPVWKTWGIIRRTQPDVVHFNESYDFRCLLLMLLCPGQRFVTSVHDPIPHAGERISLKKFKHWVRDQIRRRSHGLIVYGQRLRRILAEYSHIPTERIYSVPHGEYRYYSYFDRGESHQSLNGAKKLLFFGRWEDYKGLDVLVEAEPLICRRVPDARIILAGEGRLSLRDLQPRMAHPDHFEIRNYSIPDAEVPDLFRQSDVVVLPYLQATQSGPLHIAGTFARPVVVSRVGAMPEVVEDGETGILVSAGDPKELADAVCYLLENPELARRMGEKARSRMAQSESLESVAQAHIEVYRQVIRRPPSGPRSHPLMIFLQTVAKKIKRDPNYALDESLQLRDLAAMFWKLGTGLLRGWYHRPFLEGVSGLIFIGKGVKLRNRGHITLGKNFIAEDGCEIQGVSRLGVRFGDNVTVGSYAMIRPSGYYGREIGEGLEVGDRSNIGPYCYLGASGGITIGSEVMMGPRVSFFSENHNFDRTDCSMRQQGVTRRPIVVEDDCWLASGSTILAGVTIGRGSVIGAGSVVTRDVPPYSVAAGNPARVIRSRIKNEPRDEVSALVLEGLP